MADRRRSFDSVTDATSSMATSQASDESSHAWTPSRVRAALTVHYPRRAGGLNTAAAAEGLAVSERTIRRWTSDTTTDHYTDAQVQHRIGPLLPPAAVLADEQKRLAHDLQGLEWMTKDRSRIPVLWRNNGWLKPYQVYIAHLTDKRVCTVRITDKTDLGRGKGGAVLQHLEFPTRIHAEAHVLQMLGQLVPWRIVAPEGWKLSAPTRCWLDTTPDSALHTTHESHATTRENP